MAERFPGDGATANGFSCRHLHEDETRLLYEAEYAVPPDMRVPGAWRISVGGVSVPPPPHRGGASCGDRPYPVLSAAGDEGRAEVHPRQPAVGAVLPSPPRRAARGHQRRRALRKAQLRQPPPLVGRARPHAGGRPRVHRGRQHAQAGVPRSPLLPPPAWELVDAETHGPGCVLLLVRPLIQLALPPPVKPEPQDTPVSQRTRSSGVRITESSPPLPGLSGRRWSPVSPRSTRP